MRNREILRNALNNLRNRHFKMNKLKDYLSQDEEWPISFSETSATEGYTDEIGYVGRAKRYKLSFYDCISLYCRDFSDNNARNDCIIDHCHRVQFL